MQNSGDQIKEEEVHGAYENYGTSEILKGKAFLEDV
jgi:hypothetical protein